MNESTENVSPLRGVTFGNHSFSRTLCHSSGFARWASNSTPYSSLSLASSASKLSLSPSVAAPPNCPVDLKCELEEGETKDLESISPDVRMESHFHSHPGPLRLASVDPMALNGKEVLFFFGVLALQKLLLPRFHYTSAQQGGSWGVTLTIYGHTITRSQGDESQEQAKVGVCRESLNKLRAEYPNWIVPIALTSEPPSSGWDWHGMLHNYSLCNGLPLPKYTKYFHETGYRHEVEVEGVTYFGALKSYPEEFESQNATAMVALQESLVSAKSSFSNALGPLTLEQSYKHLMRLAPEAPSYTEAPHRSDAKGVFKRKAREDDAPIATQGARARKKRRKTAKSSKRPRASKNTQASRNNQASTKFQVPKSANFLPVSRCRIAPPSVEVPVEPEKSRWPLDPQQINKQLAGVETHTERLHMICHLLSLDYPDIQVRRLDQRFTDTMGHYYAAAFFQDDPFLARAGAIGAVNLENCTSSEVQEMCTQRVLRYLIDMVKEDIRLEETAARARRDRERWRTAASKRAMSFGGYHSDLMQVD